MLPLPSVRVVKAPMVASLPGVPPSKSSQIGSEEQSPIMLVPPPPSTVLVPPAPVAPPALVVVLASAVVVVVVVLLAPPELVVPPSVLLVVALVVVVVLLPSLVTEALTVVPPVVSVPLLAPPTPLDVVVSLVGPEPFTALPPGSRPEASSLLQAKAKEQSEAPQIHSQDTCFVMFVFLYLK